MKKSELKNYIREEVQKTEKNSKLPKNLKINSTITIPPSLTSDPISKQGESGVVKAINTKENILAVMFKDGKIGLYSLDIFITNEASELKNPKNPIKEASEPYQLNVVFKDPEDYIRAKQWFSEESDFYASSEHDEFQTLSFEVADQDDADATERAIDQELLNHGEIESWYFEIEGDSLYEQETVLEKNIIKNIFKVLKRRNPDIEDKKILMQIKDWLETGKNLVTATNSSGESYTKDVIVPIEKSLKDFKVDENLNEDKNLQVNNPKIEKIVAGINNLIAQAIDSDGDPIGVIEPGTTWEEPYTYSPIEYTDGQLKITSRSLYKNTPEVEVIPAEYMEEDGIPTLKTIMKMYKKITSKSQLQEGPEEINNAYYDILAKIAKYAKQLNDDDAYQLHQQLKSFFNRLLEDKSPIKEAGRSYRVSKDAIEVNQLKPGDILRGSGAEIIAISSGLNTPSGKMDVTIKYPNGREETKQWGKYTKVVADSKDKVTTEVTIVDKNTKPEEISSLKRSKDPKTVDLAVSQAKKTSTPVSIAEEDDVEKEDDWYKSKDEDTNKDKEPSKSELKKDAKVTKGIAKAKDELASLTKEMKSLARQYKEAKGAEKDKIVDDLKKKTKLKRELEAILDR
jgi:hypothetical protein